MIAGGMDTSCQLHSSRNSVMGTPAAGSEEDWRFCPSKKKPPIEEMWDVMMILPHGTLSPTTTVLRMQNKGMPDYMDLWEFLAAEAGACERMAPGWECTLDGLILNNKNTAAALQGIGSRRVVVQVVPADQQLRKRSREIEDEEMASPSKRSKGKSEDEGEGKAAPALQGSRFQAHEELEARKQVEAALHSARAEAETWRRKVEEVKSQCVQMEAEAALWRSCTEEQQSLSELWQMKAEQAESCQKRAEAETEAAQEELKRWRSKVKEEWSEDSARRKQAEKEAADLQKAVSKEEAARKGWERKALDEEHRRKEAEAKAAQKAEEVEYWQLHAEAEVQRARLKAEEAERRRLQAEAEVKEAREMAQESQLRHEAEAEALKMRRTTQKLDSELQRTVKSKEAELVERHRKRQEERAEKTRVMCASIGSNILAFEDNKWKEDMKDGWITHAFRMPRQADLRVDVLSPELQFHCPEAPQHEYSFRLKLRPFKTEVAIDVGTVMKIGWSPLPGPLPHALDWPIPRRKCKIELRVLSFKTGSWERSEICLLGRGDKKSEEEYANFLANYPPPRGGGYGKNCSSSFFFFPTVYGRTLNLEGTGPVVVVQCRLRLCLLKERPKRQDKRRWATAANRQREQQQPQQQQQQ